LPFKCPFCEGYFCGDHRLPENHACPEILRVRSLQKIVVEQPIPPTSESKLEPLKSDASLYHPFQFKRPAWTSSTETLHLAVGASLVMAVGLSMYGNIPDWVHLISYDMGGLIIPSAIFAFIFVSHELAHKIVAKMYGLWAEFRLSMVGALLTLLSIAPIPLKIISPGFVMITGAADKKIIGLTSLAGPLLTIILTLMFFLSRFFITDGYLSLTILRGASLGAWLALLNLMPFSIMDGAKVYWWNKKVWTISFISSVVLALAVSGHLPY